MKLFLLLAAFVLAALIVCNKNEKRACYYVIGTFFMPIFYEGVHLLLPIAFILSLIVHDQIKKSVNNFPFTDVLLLILVILLVISFYDSRLTGLKNVTVPLTYFINTYVFLFVGFNLIRNRTDWKNVTLLLAAVFIVYALYGIFTWLIQKNPLYDFYSTVFGQSGIWSSVQRRGYRVNSFLDNPIAYGMVMATGVMSLYVYNKLFPSKKIIVVLVLSVINVVIANSRTSLMAFFMMVFLFLVFYYKLSWKGIASIMSVFLLFFSVYIFFKDKLGIVDSLIGIFVTGGDSTMGSDLNLKTIQLQASYALFCQSPIFGHGLNYYRDVIAVRFGGKTDLFGLEGYGYRMMVEMGLLMIIAFVLYFVKVIKTIFRNYRVSRLFASLLLAQFLSFIFYIFATGEYGGVFEFCMIMIGLNFRMMIERAKNRKHFLSISE